MGHGVWDKTICFSVFFWSCILQDQLKEQCHTLQKSNPKLSKKQCKIIPKSTPKSIFFWTPFGDAWRPRFWGGFGTDLGSILGPFWGQKSVWKRLDKSSKKWLEKSHARNPTPRGKPGLWSLKRDQSDWWLAAGNWKLAGLGTGRPVRT